LIPSRTDTLVASFLAIARHLPPAVQQGAIIEGASTLPLLDLLRNVGAVIEAALEPFGAQNDLGLFSWFREKLKHNVDLVAEKSRSKRAVYPSQYDGTPAEIASAFLVDTPFEGVFLESRVPFVLDAETRFSGHWIIAPPGRGKTNLLHTMLIDDLEQDASIIIMDSKGDLIGPIRELKDLEDRLILVDPDPHNPIAINPLDIPKSDIALAVGHLEYIFSSLLESKMTPLQTVLFRSVLRALITSFPNPTLETFRDIITNGYDKYIEHIKVLPQDLQDFFFKEFNTKVYEDRKREIVWRLRLLLENDTMRGMMLAMRTRFDIGAAMDAGKIIIINNSKALLGDQGAEFFGRFFIAQVLAAAQARSGRRAQDKKPVYFYIDECQNVIARDERISTILDECRSQRVALILAHQRTEQITSQNVLSALANCAIRYANSDDEARYLAPRLRTTPEFLQSLRRGEFAAFVRDMTTQALALKIPRADFSDAPKFTAAETAALKERMHKQYGVQLPPRLPASPRQSKTVTTERPHHLNASARPKSLAPNQSRPRAHRNRHRRDKKSRAEIPRKQGVSVDYLKNFFCRAMHHCHTT